MSLNSFKKFNLIFGLRRNYIYNSLYLALGLGTNIDYLNISTNKASLYKAYLYVS